MTLDSDTIHAAANHLRSLGDNASKAAATSIEALLSREPAAPAEPELPSLADLRAMSGEEIERFEREQPERCCRGSQRSTGRRLVGPAMSAATTKAPDVMAALRALGEQEQGVRGRQPGDRRSEPARQGAAQDAHRAAPPRRDRRCARQRAARYRRHRHRAWRDRRADCRARAGADRAVKSAIDEIRADYVQTIAERRGELVELVRERTGDADRAIAAVRAAVGVSAAAVGAVRSATCAHEPATRNRIRAARRPDGRRDLQGRGSVDHPRAAR